MPTVEQSFLYEVRDLAIDLGLEDCEFRTDYSGRGMYGKGCVAFTFDRGSSLVIGAALALVAADWDRNNPGKEEVYADLVKSITSHSRQDSMGLGSVVYFPGLHLEGKLGIGQYTYSNVIHLGRKVG